jgi:TatD DNase family protein
MFIDSHCHLHMIESTELNDPADPAWDLDLEAILTLAKEYHVEHMLCVGTTLQDIEVMQAIVNAHAQVSMSIGLHPNETINKEPTVDELLALTALPKVVAIGETGLDYYRSTGDLSWQKNRFKTHIQAAIESKKPLIIHTRQAPEDTIALLIQHKAKQVGGVIHCFTEDWEMAKQAMDLGFYISFSGIVTFKNARALQEVAKKVPLERLLIETDSPYLAPMPHRGKINQPAYVKFVAEFLAHLKDISVETLAKQTTENYYQVFGA